MKLLKTIIAATLAAACVLPAQAADKTMSTDIVVLGAGCGGTSASVAAQELGAKVILLEKQGITAVPANSPKASWRLSPRCSVTGTTA